MGMGSSVIESWEGILILVRIKIPSHDSHPEQKTKSEGKRGIGHEMLPQERLRDDIAQRVAMNRILNEKVLADRLFSLLFFSDSNNYSYFCGRVATNASRHRRLTHHRGTATQMFPDIWTLCLKHLHSE